MRQLRQGLQHRLQHSGVRGKHSATVPHPACRAGQQCRAVVFGHSCRSAVLTAVRPATVCHEMRLGRLCCSHRAHRRGTAERSGRQVRGRGGLCECMRRVLWWSSSWDSSDRHALSHPSSAGVLVTSKQWGLRAADGGTHTNTPPAAILDCTSPSVSAVAAALPLPAARATTLPLMTAESRPRGLSLQAAQAASLFASLRCCQTVLSVEACCCWLTQSEKMRFYCAPPLCDALSHASTAPHRSSADATLAARIFARSHCTT